MALRPTTSSDGACTCLAWRNVLINTWHITASLPGLELVGRLGQELMKQYPAGLANFTLMENKSLALVMLGAAEREGAIALAQAMKASTVASGFVIEGTGTRTAVTRLLVAGVLMVANPTYPLKMLRSDEEAATWLLEVLKVGDPGARAELLAAARLTRIASAAQAAGAV